MEPLFSVLAKLLGVLLAYWGATTLASGFLAPGGPHAVVFHLASAGIALAFAFLLLLRTEWVAGKVGITSRSSTGIGNLDPAVALRTGIILIGLYVFLVRLAGVLNFVYIHLGPASVGGIGQPLARALIECIPLLLALVLVFRAERIAELILKAQSSPAG